MSVHAFLTETILELNDIEEDKLTPELSLEELALESLDYVEIQVLIKKRYAIDIAPSLFSSGQIKTLGELSAYIEEHRAVAQQA